MTNNIYKTSIIGCILLFILGICFFSGCIEIEPSPSRPSDTYFKNITVIEKIDEFEDNLINPDRHIYYIIDNDYQIYRICKFAPSDELKLYIQFNINNTYLVKVRDDCFSSYPYIIEIVSKTP